MSKQNRKQLDDAGIAELLFKAKQNVEVVPKPLAIGAILEEIDDGNIDISPTYQREYKEDRKDLVSFSSRLIESILLDIPLPSIYLTEQEGIGNKYEVVDGQQRLSTIRAFKLGQYPNGKKFVLKNLTELPFLNGLTYEEMPSFVKTDFKRYTINTFIIKKSSSIDAKFKIFDRLNQGSLKLAAQEIRNNLYRGPFNDSTIKAASLENFIKVKDTDISKHYRDRELFCRYTIIAHCGKYKGDGAHEVNKIMEEANSWDAEKIQSNLGSFDKFLGFCLYIFGDKAFRKIELSADNEIISQKGKHNKIGGLNQPLFMSLALALHTYDDEVLSLHKDAIKKRLLELVAVNPVFKSAFIKSPSNPNPVAKRAEMIGFAINQAIMSESNQEATIEIKIANKLGAILSAKDIDFFASMKNLLIVIDDDSEMVIRKHISSGYVTQKKFASYKELSNDIYIDPYFWEESYGEDVIDKILTLENKIKDRLKERVY